MADLSRLLSIVMLVVDFQVEVEMVGMVDFLGNSTGRYARETAEALERIGCTSEAEILREILRIAEGVGMTHAAIQAERSKLPVWTVTSFAATHGPAWEEPARAIEALGHQIDCGQVLSQLERWAADHEDDLRSDLERIA
ncbi:MAG: DMP19 family protein [Sandaracinaceae bacterium]|nr:DMP19 family protein [Sandaracinaceae bacterium]